MSSKAAKMMGMPGPPPPLPMMGGLPPPPMLPPPPGAPGMMDMPPPPPMMMPPMALPPDKPKKKKKPQPTGFLMWTAGGAGPKREKSLKVEKKPESGKHPKSAAEKPSAPNGQAMSRPSAPNGKAAKTSIVRTKRFGIFA